MSNICQPQNEFSGSLKINFVTVDFPDCVRFGYVRTSRNWKDGTGAMGKNRALLLGASTLACIWVAASNAETITYGYDALGRLRTSAVSGGPDNGTSTAICYDAASNRERYITNKAGPAVCTPAPTPTPTPAP
ncbi:hypothetical protein [Sphingomonas sp.]|uniref:hypothetical protein n=1 Tax=Sphingomonas sp. TaxID=28214 RepID=UPI003BAC4EF9